MVMVAENIPLNLDDMGVIRNVIKSRFLLLPNQVVKFQRGQVIYHQGDKIDKVGFILEGVMKCANYTNAGDEINPHFFYEGEIFPEYLLLAGENEYIYTLVTEKRSKVILVDLQSFKDLILSDMEFCQSLIAYMAKRGLLSERWRICNCLRNIRSRIAFMLLEIYGVSDEGWVEIKDSQRIIATKLQVSRPAYNQEMIKLEEENIIKRDKGKIKILKRRTLEGYI